MAARINHYNSPAHYPLRFQARKSRDDYFRVDKGFFQTYAQLCIVCIGMYRIHVFRVTISARMKKRTPKIFIKSGYQPVAGS